jgi:hypothetical protein
MVCQEGWHLAEGKRSILLWVQIESRGPAIVESPGRVRGRVKGAAALFASKKPCALHGKAALKGEPGMRAGSHDFPQKIQLGQV